MKISDIEKLYFKGKLPIINGIITKDKYIKINIDKNILSFDETNNYENISSLEDDCSNVNVFNAIRYKDYTAYFGEGSYGGDGFITIIDKNNKIVWIAFHDRINPIIDLEIFADKIIAINNCDIKYVFNINWEEI